MLRKYRRRKRVYKKTRRLIRVRRRTPKMKTEVKFVDINFINNAVDTENLPVANKSLSNQWAVGAANTDGILSAIVQGTAANQRVGNKIVVKAISWHSVLWLCPATTDTNNYDTCTCRVFCAAVPTYFGGSDIADFWSNSVTSHLHDFPRRSNYNIYMDKILSLNSPNDITGLTRTGRGAMRHYKATLNFRNRVVEYKDGTNSPKLFEHRFNFFNFAFSPSVANGTQVICHNSVIRIYFTDP